MKNQVIIEKIILTNFKGIENKIIVFSSITDLFGANGTGKTSIYDAFLWLLFGKNSEDKKDFNIKNTVETQLNRQEHEVEALIIVNGGKNHLKRIYKEKWVKKRGEEISEYAGNETLFYWNDVPMQLKEFTAKVNLILDENIFKLITNPLGFASLKWQDRRSILLQISGDISDIELASGNKDFEALVANLTQGKTLEDYKKQIIASVKKAKDELKDVPVRIDEVLKSKPEGDFDFKKLAVELEFKKTEILKIQALISNKYAALDNVLEANKNKKINASNLKFEIEKIESDAKTQARNSMISNDSELKSLRLDLDNTIAEINTSENAIKTLQSKLNNLESEVIIIDNKMSQKREEWNSENAKELKFNDEDFHCPTCKREFESGDLEVKKTELLENFKKLKSNKLAEIQRQGKSLSEEKSNNENEILTLKNRIEKGKSLIKGLYNSKELKESAFDFELSKSNDQEPKDENLIYECILSLDQDYKSKKAELIAIELTIEKAPEVDTKSLEMQKESLESDIDKLKIQLNFEVQINSINERVKLLKLKEKDLAQQVANVEKSQFAIEKFEKFKMESLESKVNSKFKTVKFRMFETQVNGGESPCCEILVKGVPFADANTAGKINAGIEIINILCDFYQITAPVFIDNRESCTDIIESKSQIVSLIVSPKDKVLRVA